MKDFEFDFEKFSRDLNQKALRHLNESVTKEFKPMYNIGKKDYDKAARALERALNGVSNDDVIRLLDYEIENMEKTLKSYYAERERFNKYTDFDEVVDHEMQKNYYEGWLEALMDFKFLLSDNFNLEKEQENEW